MSEQGLLAFVESLMPFIQTESEFREPAGGKRVQVTAGLISEGFSN